ncbi:MAG: hypothetical protein CVT66_09330 [Actinobacteria bacterium HGW-Actinobacteria-6]|nr:MAG: hypothetical protein CVT66_09330 [Actinobacteria bacterium HGW-Actinobacteria-6]
MRMSRRPLTPLMALLSIIVLISGCSKAGLEYIPAGGTYTMQDAQSAAAVASLDSVRDVMTADASALRTDRLTDLRSNGDEASALADMLTVDFPSEIAAVPLRIEAATVDGTSVWLVIEAWGDEGEVLTHRRLWVIDKTTLEVIGSSSYR